LTDAPRKGGGSKDRRVAERALMKAQVGIDEGRVGVNHAKDDLVRRLGRSSSSGSPKPE
jgi:hypothetical protein